MRAERGRGGSKIKEVEGGKDTVVYSGSLPFTPALVFSLTTSPHNEKFKKKELTMEAGQQPGCQRFPLTESKGATKKGKE